MPGGEQGIFAMGCYGISEEDETADGPGDCEIMKVMGNRRPSTKRASVHVEKKWDLVEHIYDCGIRYTPETDVHFLNS
jgi:hypothetical protein